MRESAFYAMEQQNRKQTGLVLDQLEFLQTRQHAMELIHNESTLLHRAIWFLQPAKYWKSVDHLQTFLIQKGREDAAKVAAERKAKPKLVTPPPPKIEIVKG